MINKFWRIFFIAVMLFQLTGQASAYWVWSPDLGKWVNPKTSAKDSPDDQFNWAMDFYRREDWDRAIEEFEKLEKAYPTSKLAAEGVYYMGLSWQEKGDTAKAADSFKRLIDKYPYSDRINDAIEQEFKIANELAAGGKVKVLGMPVLPGQEKAIEIYRHIVKNSPFGAYGDQAQFQIGEVLKSLAEYEEASKAYQAVIDEYPNSPLVAQAKYEMGYVAMQASDRAQYSEQTTEQALEEFQGFKETFPEHERNAEVDESIRTLRAQKAQTLMDTAQFYEKQKKFRSARVYYGEILDRYGDTPQAEHAKERYDALVKQENEPDKKSWFSVPKLPKIPKLKLW